MGDRFVVYIHDSYDGGNTEYTDSAPCKVKLKVGRHVTEISFPHAISPLSMVLYLLCPRRSLPAPAARRWSRTASSSASTSATVQRSAARTRTTCMVPSTDPTRERFCARQKRPYRCSHQERRGHHRIQAHCNWDGAAGGGFAGSVECVEGCREDFFVASIFIKNGWLFSWTACGKIIKSSKIVGGKDTAVHQYPWLVVSKTNTNRHTCRLACCTLATGESLPVGAQSSPRSGFSPRPIVWGTHTHTYCVSKCKIISFFLPAPSPCNPPHKVLLGELDSFTKKET